ncbi:acyl-CoA dehydrogenase [Sulfodiicoccus acidiphilus]|uniref:Acyl-CoA dehydrogenase n=1 Tax=Sulfodiicoccus acidiphilus TaxID=1670455 RepID=A0A348B1G7_9CREN|nr:acyl-CoA dehydrogenase family protein [Sulfodiicoccus acidiphilus]BBD72019.1 acyl-CoA dehydrogenase [Sulfodiicoccus acidiphilus]GGT92144.1 acyl-CoA dehydrogenase [Sulfodiicoccus acidiphilus]
MIETFTEDQLLLRSTAKEFAERELSHRAERVEAEGVDAELREKLASAGFLGATVPSKYGGAELDSVGFMLALQEMAKVSPTTALFVLIQNFAGRALATAKLGDSFLPDVVSGKLVATVSLEDALGQGEPLRVEGDRVRGERNYLLLPKADVVLVQGPKLLIALTEGIREVKREVSLGFRGLGLSKVVVDSPLRTFTEVDGDFLGNLLYGASLEVAAIALGMAQGALQRAIDYARSRRAFNALLAEFQPLAFELLQYDSEVRAIERFVYSVEKDSIEAGEAKLMALDLARRTARMSLQVHGGYGYFEYTGVEKFYRDSAALESLTTHYLGERARLANSLLGVEPKY